MKSQETRRISGAVWVWAAALCLAPAANALELAFPGTAELVRTSSVERGQHLLATGPWTEAGIPTEAAEGTVQQFTWQITGQDVTTMTLLTALREQLLAQGFEITFSCEAATCGGFDFRHGLPVGDAPDMHVDLSEYFYFAATAPGDDGQQSAALMISQGGTTGFVHLSLVQPATAAVPPVVQSSRAPELDEDPASTASAVPAGDLIAQLTALGVAPLDDLQFQTGASELTGDNYPSLLALAAYLAENPARRVVLVGHTDFMGSLAGNIALSEERAAAVRRYLTRELGVRPGQVAAEGIGYLAPRAANTSAEGREANRRVEVVLADPG